MAADRAIVEVVSQPLVSDENMSAMKRLAIQKCNVMLIDNLPHVWEAVIKDAIAGGAPQQKLAIEQMMPVTKQTVNVNLSAEFTAEEIVAAAQAADKNRG